MTVWHFFCAGKYALFWKYAENAGIAGGTGNRYNYMPGKACINEKKYKMCLNDVDIRLKLIYT